MSMAFAPVFQRPFSATFDRRTAAAAGNGLLNSLVAYWPMNEAAGANNALDLHTNNLTLTQQYSPGAAGGKVYATARLFTPASYHHFFRTNESLLQAGDVDLTVAMWMWCDVASLGLYYPFAKWSTASNREYAVFSFTDNKLRFAVSNLGTNSIQAVNNDAVPYQQWFLFVGWHDAVANTVNSQINSGTVVSVAHSTGIFVGVSTLTVSKQSNAFGSWWPGRIGPIMLWKSAPGAGGALSAAQRTALYNGGAGLAYAAFTT